MPEPAGTGLSRRSFLLRSAGLGARRSTAPGSWPGCRRSRRASRRRRPRGPGTVLLSVFMDGGVDSLSLLAPVGDPQYRKLRPTLARRRRAARSPRTRGSRGIRRPRALADLHAEGKVSVLPAVGYTNADQSHFTSRHFWEVGALDPHLRTGWLGPRARSRRLAGQPAAGRVAGRAALARRWRPRATRSRRSTSPRTSASGRRARGARPRTWPCRRSPTIGHALRGSRDPAVAQAAQAAAFAGGVRDALAPLGDDGKPAYTPAAAYPQTAEALPEAAGGLRRDARRRAADPRRLDQRAGRLRHARQPGGVAAQEPASSRSTRCSPSSATSRRAGSPTAC